MTIQTPTQQVKEEVRGMMDTARNHLRALEQSPIPEVRDAVKLAWDYMTLAAWDMQIGAEFLFKAHSVRESEERGRKALADLKERFGNEKR